MTVGIERALIVGGGIGGMAAAIALRKRGVEVDLIDIDPDWKVYGAGITITGPTLRAFRDLGLLDAIRKEGFFVEGQRIFLYDGTLLAEQSPPPAAPGLPAAGGIMRPKLHQIMAAEVRKLGVDVRLGITVAAIDDQPAAAVVRFSDGLESRYDIVVGADGIYSKLRSMLFPDAAEPVYCGQMSWRVVAPRPHDMVRSEFFFGSKVIGGINPCSDTEVYAFALHPEPNPQRIPEADQPAFLRALLKDFGGHMGVIRDGIDSSSSIVGRPFEYAFQPKPWNVGRVVLIGDAAHATTPHLASGAGIAVEDGLVLAEEMERCAGDVLAGLEAFTERRFERCRYVVDQSVKIANIELEGASPQEIGALMGEGMAYLARTI